MSLVDSVLDLVEQVGLLLIGLLLLDSELLLSWLSLRKGFLSWLLLLPSKLLLSLLLFPNIELLLSLLLLPSIELLLSLLLLPSELLLSRSSLIECLLSWSLFSRRPGVGKS